MPELEVEFDDINHAYMLGGVKVPGCTNVLRIAGLTPSFNFLTVDDLTFYQERGHAIHKAVELLLRGTLDRRTLSAEIKSYLVSFEKAAKEYGLEVMADRDGQPFVEKPLIHPVYRFGVTEDIVAKVKKRPSVVEIKGTSAHSPATAVQTGCQEMAVKLELPGEYDRYAFRLIPNEMADVRQYKERSDGAVWLSALNIANWKINNKLAKERYEPRIAA